MAEEFERRAAASFDAGGHVLHDPAAVVEPEPLPAAPLDRPRRPRARRPDIKPKPAAGLPAPTELTGRETRIEAARGWWAGASANLRGSVMMIGAFTLFAVMMTFIKLVGARISMPQMLIVRQVVMTAVLLAIVGRRLPALIRTQRPGLQITRGFFSLGAMLCGFTAIVHMPLAEATALGFSQVLFVTLAAIIVLREVVDGRRWIAMAIGFCGVLVMLRPTGEAFNAYAILAILGALFGAGITITVRVLGDRENTFTILLWQGAVILLALVVPAWMLWREPTPQEWLLMLGLGLVGLGGQWLITKAYQIGEASALAPLDFVRLLLATLSGYLIFAEVPTPVTIIGATLVVGGTVYTMRRNAGRKPAPAIE